MTYLSDGLDRPPKKKKRKASGRLWYQRYHHAMDKGFSSLEAARFANKNYSLKEYRVARCLYERNVIVTKFQKDLMAQGMEKAEARALAVAQAEGDVETDPSLYTYSEFMSNIFEKGSPR